jgi:hypothetical protein
MKIAISKPCHEDWGKMTANEQGAFCLVCTKNVVDFTSRTLEEIKAFFARPVEERVCGRFKEEQLEELNEESFIERFMGLKLARRIAMIVALGFITWLSGSGELHAQGHTKTKMGIAVAVPKDTTKCTKDRKPRMIIKERPALNQRTKQEHGFCQSYP